MLKKELIILARNDIENIDVSPMFIHIGQN